MVAGAAASAAARSSCLQPPAAAQGFAGRKPAPARTPGNDAGMSRRRRLVGAAWSTSMLRLAHGSTPTSTAAPPPAAAPPPVQAVASSSSTDTPRQQRTASDMLRGALLSDLQQQRRELDPPAREERGVAGDPPAASPGQQRGAAQPSPDYAAYDPTGPELSSPVTSPEAAMALSAYEAAATQRGLVTVCFCMQHPAEPGQRMHVTGTAKELGSWGLQQSLELEWTEGHNWRAEVQMPGGSLTEYKYVLVDSAGSPLAWQDGNNSVLALRAGDTRVEVFDGWRARPSAPVLVNGDRPETRESRLLAWADDLHSQLAKQKGDLRRTRMLLTLMEREMGDAGQEARAVKAQGISEARLLRSQLSAKEADLVAARAANGILKEQLSETTASLYEAIETAEAVLLSRNCYSNAEESDSDEDAAAAAAATPAQRKRRTVRKAAAAGEKAESGAAVDAAAAAAPRKRRVSRKAVAAAAADEEDALAAVDVGEELPNGEAAAAKAKVPRAKKASAKTAAASNGSSDGEAAASE